MERLNAADRESGVARTALTADQKKRVGEARGLATARLAEREILFADAMRGMPDPVEREKAEREYQIDRQRIHDDTEKAIEEIHRAKSSGSPSKPPRRGGADPR